MTQQANILSFDKARAHNSSSRRAYSQVNPYSSQSPFSAADSARDRTAATRPSATTTSYRRQGSSYTSSKSYHPAERPEQVARMPRTQSTQQASSYQYDWTRERSGTRSTRAMRGSNAYDAQVSHSSNRRASRIPYGVDAPYTGTSRTSNQYGTNTLRDSHLRSASSVRMSASSEQRSANPRAFRDTARLAPNTQSPYSYSHTSRTQYGAPSSASRSAQESTRPSQTERAAQNSRSTQHNTQKTQGFFQKKRKEYNARRADKAYERVASNYEAKPEETSRAALYQMEMGRTQKRSTRMQDEGSASRRTQVSAKRSGISASPWKSRLAIVASVCLVAVVMLYGPVANYYNEIRSYQQLEAEYSVLMANNQQTQATIDYLGTDEGLEEYAHNELGWIRQDEHAVEVSGVATPDETTSTERVVNTIPEGSVSTPETWYSPVLDVVFGYSHS